MNQSPRPGKASFAIIGGGISGLSAAFYLHKHLSQTFKDDFEICVFEASHRFGGVIETLQAKGCTIESGPDSFITNKPGLLDLASELAISDQIISTNKDGRGAYVLAKGRLNKLPDGFVMLAPSKLLPFCLSAPLSVSGKLRAMLDLFLPARKSKQDESLASFVRRRFGVEVLQKLAQPLVAGIYVGDAEKLSAACAAERFVQIESTKGSVIRGLMAQVARSSRDTGSGARYGLFASFKNGIQTVVDALINSLVASGVDLRKDCEVHSVRSLMGGTSTKKIAVQLDDRTVDFDGVILATPARVTARLLGNDQALSASLDKIPAASSAVANFVFDKSEFAFEPDGFGVVIPETEMANSGYAAIAVSFASKKFAGRAPQDLVVVRVFLGGVKMENLLAESDERLLERAQADLAKLVGAGKPLYSRVHRWHQAMPQYLVGHKDVVADAGSHLPSGVLLAGASYHGVGLPDCVATAKSAALQLIDHYNASLADSPRAAVLH